MNESIMKDAAIVGRIKTMTDGERFDYAVNVAREAASIIADIQEFEWLGYDVVVPLSPSIVVTSCP
jgi:hypothetical protein